MFKKFQISWRSDNSNGYFTCTPIYIYDHIWINYS